MLDLEQPLLCAEGVQHIVLSIPRFTLPQNLEDLEVTRQSVWVIRIPDCILVPKIQALYTVCSDGCVVDEVNPTMTTYLQYSSTINSWVKNMIPSLRNNIIIIIKFWLCVNIFSTGVLTRTVVLILCPCIQLILVNIIIFGEIGNLVNLRREYVFVVEFWSMFLHMLISFIDIIKNLIHPILVGVTQYHNAHEWMEELVHHISLVEEQGIIDDLLDPPMNSILYL